MDNLETDLMALLKDITSSKASKPFEIKELCCFWQNNRTSRY
jgi:hypothetical protein